MPAGRGRQVGRPCRPFRPGSGEPDPSIAAKRSSMVGIRIAVEREQPPQHASEDEAYAAEHDDRRPRPAHGGCEDACSHGTRRRNPQRLPPYRLAPQRIIELHGVRCARRHVRRSGRSDPRTCGRSHAPRLAASPRGRPPRRRRKRPACGLLRAAGAGRAVQPADLAAVRAAPRAKRRIARLARVHANVVLHPAAGAAVNHARHAHSRAQRRVNARAQMKGPRHTPVIVMTTCGAKPVFRIRIADNHRHAKRKGAERSFLSAPLRNAVLWRAGAYPRLWANRMRSARMAPKNSPTPPPIIPPNMAVHSGSACALPPET